MYGTRAGRAMPDGNGERRQAKPGFVRRWGKEGAGVENNLS